MTTSLVSRKSFIKMSSISALVGAATLLSACSFDSGSSSNAQRATSSELSGSLLVVGSTALQPLAEAAAEGFMQKHAGVTISVQGGGSGQGLTQIVQGAVQVGNSDVFAEEKIKDQSQTAKLQDNKVAVVGMAPVTHKGVGVSHVTLEQLQQIFTGQVTNWKELGGADQAILVINRASGSGTRATFESHVLKGVSVPESFKPQEQDSSGTVAKMVAKTPGAISYLALSYITENLQALGIDGVTPSEDTIATGAWKIWSYEHMYTQKDASEVTKAYIDYMLSDEVQDSLVEKLGYIPITKMQVERTADGTISPRK